MKKVVFLNFIVFLVYSCSNNQKKEAIVASKTNRPTERKIIEKKFLGIWRIDSLGENNKVTQRLTNDSLHYQAFFFTFDYKIMLAQNKGQGEKRFIIGDFKVEDDSVFFIDEKYNKVAFRYKYEFYGNNQLKLWSGTSVSERNPAKPLLYFKKIPNERSMKILKVIKN